MEPQDWTFLMPRDRVFGTSFLTIRTPKECEWYEIDCRPTRELLLDLQIDKKLIFVVKGADRFNPALLPIVLCPYLIIRVLRELAEAVVSLRIREIALHRKAAAILQIDHRAFDRRTRGIEHLALDDALLRPPLLRRRSYTPHGDRKDRHATGGKNDFAGQGTEQDRNTLHGFSIRVPLSVPAVTHLPLRRCAWGLRRHNRLHRWLQPPADRPRQSQGPSRTHRIAPFRLLPPHRHQR